VKTGNVAYRSVIVMAISKLVTVQYLSEVLAKSSNASNNRNRHLKMAAYHGVKRRMAINENGVAK